MKWWNILHNNVSPQNIVMDLNNIMASATLTNYLEMKVQAKYSVTIS